METQLNIIGVSKSFGITPVLTDIHAAITRGEFITLLGPSGCGKTTLLRIIAGLESADAGAITLDGADLLALPANRRPVNMVFQNYALFPHLNVFDNVAFGLRIRRFNDGDVKSRVQAALAMLQLEPLADRRANELSGGQKQRAALARALVNEPALLLLDEPMSALDARLRAQVRVELRQLQRKLGRTFILVTHDQDEAMTVSDRILVMNGGRIEQAGSPSEVYDHPATRFVAEFLGAANLIAARRTEQGVETDLGSLQVAREPLWERGTVAIRPERIRLSTDESAPNRLRLRVKDMIYRGDHLDVFLEPGNLRMWCEPSAQCARGRKSGSSYHPSTWRCCLTSESSRRSGSGVSRGVPRDPCSDTGVTSALGWIAPGILWLLLFLAIPSLLLLALAFATKGAYGEILWEPTLRNFKKLAGFSTFGWAPDYLWTFLRTVWLALVTTVACIVLAYPIALFVAARPQRWRAFWLVVLMIPFCTNLVVRTYGWQLILPRSIYPGAIAVYIGMISSNLSFAILPIYTSVEQIDWSIPEAARDLYGSRWAVFRHGILPQTWPGLGAAAIITFIPCLGMFVVSDLLGGGKYELLGNLIQRQFGASRDFPFGAALSFTLILATLIALRFFRRSAEKEGL